MWSGGRSLRYDGAHYRLAGVHAGPTPAHNMGIWLGSLGPRSLALLGRAADGWLPSYPYVPPEKLDAANRRIDEAAAAAGRDAAAIRRAYNVNGRITEGPSDGFLKGPVSQWVDELSALATDHRVDTVILWAEGDQIEQVRRYAEEVVPAVRKTVG